MMHMAVFTCIGLAFLTSKMHGKTYLIAKTMESEHFKPIGKF